MGAGPRRAEHAAGPAGPSPPGGEHGLPHPSLLRRAERRTGGTQPPDRSPPAAPARRWKPSTLPKLSPSARAARPAAAPSLPAAPLGPVPPPKGLGRLRRTLPGRPAPGGSAPPPSRAALPRPRLLPAPDGQWAPLGLSAPWGGGVGGGRPRPLAGRRPMAERGKRRRAEQGAARGRAGRGGARRAGSAVGCSTFSGAASRRPRPSAAVRGPARVVRPFRRLWAFPAASPRAAPRQRWGWRPGGDTPGASLAVAVSPRWLLCRGPPSAPPACRWREGGGTGEQRPWAFLGGCPQPEAWERRALALAWCCKTVPTCPGLR